MKKKYRYTLSLYIYQNYHDLKMREYKRYFHLDLYTILISDIINNMDHMRISGTETSSVILSQTK